MFNIPAAPAVKPEIARHNVPSIHTAQSCAIAASHMHISAKTRVGEHDVSCEQSYGSANNHHRKPERFMVAEIRAA